MTRRTKQHQLEDLSRSKYSLAIPRNWVMRDKDKDYGIDAEVEIFDEKNRPTGLVYLVQLKATETSDESVARKVDISIESIKYYKRLELPVLIVRYSLKQDKFYCRWAHEIDLFYAKKDAKTRRVKFCEEDVWGRESSVDTEKYLKKLRAIKSGAVTFPVPTRIVVKDDSVHGLSRGIFLTDYRLALQAYSKIAIYESDTDKAILHVHLKDDELFINLGSAAGCTFHGIEDRKIEGFAEGIAADVLLGLAVTLATIGQLEMAASIVLDDKLKKRFFDKRDLLASFIPALARTSRYGEMIDAVCGIIDSEEDNWIETITTMSTITVSDSVDTVKCANVQKLLEKILAKYIALDVEPLIGVSHYNLGNHYQSRNLYREAISHYLMARKFEPKYLHQPYFYQELGGALFLLGKYRFSSKIYKLALEKGAPNSVKPLYADSLMLGGRYKLAHEVLSEYLVSAEDDHAEWHLKNICLGNLIDKTGIEEQIRHRDEALSKIDISKVGDPAFVRDLEMAIELDSLCGLAWFNFGIEHNKSGKHEEAAFSFILCGLVQTWDIDAWVNATVCCFDKVVPIETFPLVVCTAYFFNGDEYMSALHKDLGNRLKGDALEVITNLVDELVLNITTRSEEPTFRAMDSNGIFQEINTSKNT